MGGYLPGFTSSFMPTSVGGGLAWPDVAMAGLNILGGILAPKEVSGVPAVRGPTAITKAPTAVPSFPMPGLGGVIEPTPQMVADYFKATGQVAPGYVIGERKRRRMNVCNARALRRAIRRVQGFSRFARKSFVLEKRVRIKKRRR